MKNNLLKSLIYSVEPFDWLQAADLIEETQGTLFDTSLSSQEYRRMSEIGTVLIPALREMWPCIVYGAVRFYHIENRPDLVMRTECKARVIHMTLIYHAPITKTRLWVIMKKHAKPLGTPEHPSTPMKKELKHIRNKIIQAAAWSIKAEASVVRETF